MTVRVYGVEIIPTDMATAWRNFNEFRTKAAKHILEYERKVLAGRVAAHLDRLTFRIEGPDLTDLNADLRFYGIFSYQMKQYEDAIKATDQFDFYRPSTYDPKLNIEIYEHDGRIYATINCIDGQIRDLLLNEPWVKDMSVFDQDTVDDGIISETEWNRRQAVWRTIFNDPTAGYVRNSSFSVTVVSQMNVANTSSSHIIPYIDDFDTRAEKYAAKVVGARMLAQYHRHSGLMCSKMATEVFGSSDPSVMTLHFLAMDYGLSGEGKAEIMALKNKLLTIMEPIGDHPML